MALFPASFIDDLKSHADIVQVVQERVPLRRAGTSWKGLCPFHGEKTPSFNVHGDKGYFKCFGCGVGGDVIKFIELYDKIPFPEAVRQLAGRFGLQVPEPEGAPQDAEASRDREALLKAHELAAAWFREQLAGPAGAAARRLLAERGITAEMIDRQGIGYAPATRDGLKNHLLKAGFTLALLVRSGLVLQRDEGTIVDRFRTRVMIPIHRDNGAIVAFGGRAMEAGQQPKYLNSPETPIYVKGKTLYGLHLSKTAISRTKHAVMVEGYFDWAQAYQAGITNVVASSGTALTPWQARLLKRFAAKVVLSFDPDVAGQGAAARTSELLVTEGFQVNVAMLPAGDDPDNFIRKQGGAAYQEKLRSSRPYLEYLLDRTAADHDFNNDESRRAFLGRMLTVAARIPDAAQRDQFADRLAHKARITEEVVRAEIRKAAVQKQTTLEERRLPVVTQVKPAEKGLIWALMHEPAAGMEALLVLDEADLAGLASQAILQQARSLQGLPPESLPSTLIERLSRGEAQLIEELARPSKPPADAADCVRTLKLRRLDRERAEVQRAIDALQERGGTGSDEGIVALLAQKSDVMRRIEELGAEIHPGAGSFRKGA
ncbi:MAG TPA: DNA primase [Vicinamibacterales bacterium]|nr:DNA primase [Vicinamibacterales bacterium]